ncbi:GNAT family N-acetyltransferase [Paenibacillus sedimenti]|uniref:GNAT family N-acetyltransferase n=1 Tax=Paenibacillus sedimenti TaxID=2770274 RepID=A0A926KPC1_9BACL|nr:GNAT family protein [Paenibacillus sedimenti]MBD0381544.1 GNAT family N-acetyltransferase [Paenibacillus sedimenti]
MNLSPHTLDGDRITLLPMSESHIPGLADAANDPRIWAYMEPLLHLSAVESYVREALQEQETGLSLPYCVYDKELGKIVGSTRLFEISVSHRHAEIGYTWYHPHFWRTHVNTECKYLLLRYCFETLNMLRVQLKTDLRNMRSQTAIARLGAQKEGILRQHRILHDGYIRDSVMFSIIDSEWPSVKKRLEGFMKPYPLLKSCEKNYSTQ